MNFLSGKAFLSLCAFPFMVWSFFLGPFPALAESRSAPAPVKQWADPGAMEKAKTETANPGQNTVAPAVTGDAKAAGHDNKAAPAVAPQKSAGDQKASENTGKSVMHKAIHQINPDKAARQAEEALSSAAQVKSSHAVKSTGPVEKAQARPEHAQVSAEKKKKTAAKQIKSGHVKHGAPVNSSDDAVQESFDPLNGL